VALLVRHRCERRGDGKQRIALEFKGGIAMTLLSVTVMCSLGDSFSDNILSLEINNLNCK
jgi:hypothetical protein